MANSQAAVSATRAAPRSASPLCFLMDEDFVFRRDLAEELRKSDIDVVQFSNSSRFMDMVETQSPDIVFINLNNTAPHECIRALLALKDCRYSGAVQVIGRGEPKLFDSFNTIGADFALKMLAPIQKPIKVATVQRIVLEQKLSTPATSQGGISLTEALALKLVTFLYQPKIDLKTSMMLGVEVVSRVSHPELGLLTPDQFLKGADDDALLRLSQLALVDAIKASAHFERLGIGLLLSVNISADTLSRLPIEDIVREHCPHRSDWPGVVLEVPERQVLNKIEFLKACHPKLQQCGLSIAIDNVGLGPSCLNILGQIPFAEMKIDRTLVQACSTDIASRNVCKTLIQMAHNFSTQAVAVGISTEADLRTLVGLGCDIGQGFMFGKPLDMGQVNHLIGVFQGRTALN